MLQTTLPVLPGGAGAQGRHSLQGVPRVLRDRRQKAHGTGQYLGALCHSCNIAAQTPKTIPVVFHNGGGYDFHFLLRSPVSTAPREELGEDSDNEGTESEAEGSEPERPMPMAKAAPKAKAKAKAAPKPLTACRPRSSRATTATSASESSASRAREVPADELGPAEVRGQHERLPHEPGQHDRRPQGLHAQAAAGALPADGLASPRAAAAHADGLSASKTASQAAADALRAGAGVGLHPAQAAHALRALLRRRGVGDARGVGAALLRQRAGWKSGERGGPPAGREHRQRHASASSTTLADVMESYHYVTLPGAAWDAMLRHSARETPIHLITDEQAYKDVRASVMGGLSCIFQPFAQANNPELGEEDYNPEEPVSWILYWTSTPCTRPQ